VKKTLLKADKEEPNAVIDAIFSGELER